MTKIDKHIEIVSSEISAYSVMSRGSRDTIRAVLGKHYRTVGVTIINKPADLDTLVGRQPDLVFLGMKFIPSDIQLGADNPHKIWISQFLDDQGIAYTGSAARAIKLDTAKQLAKQHVLEAGLATPGFTVVRRNLPIALQTVALSFPLFVKPTNHGGGFGIDASSLVTDGRQLNSRLKYITTGLQTDALVEEYVPGREFSVSVLQDTDSSQLSIMPIEMVTEPDERGARILGKKVKTSNSEQTLYVPHSPVRSAVCALAEAVFHALGGRDYGRIDIRLDDQGTPHFLEANFYPSLIDGYGSFPKACAMYRGMDYEAMIVSIAELGLARGDDDVEELPSMYGELVTA